MCAAVSVRGLLRAATQEAHGRVDARFARFDLASPQGYRDFLRAHLAVLPDCEAWLDASDTAGLIADWPFRRRSEALLADAGRLGVAGAMPRSPPRRLHPAEVFGMAYVLEGSRMGSAVLARRALANTDPQCRAATEYVRHGEGQGFWPSFIVALEAADAVRANPDAAIDAARATFALFAGA